MIGKHRWERRIRLFHRRRPHRGSETRRRVHPRARHHAQRRSPLPRGTFLIAKFLHSQLQPSRPSPSLQAPHAVTGSISRVNVDMQHDCRASSAVDPGGKSAPLRYGLRIASGLSVGFWTPVTVQRIDVCRQLLQLTASPPPLPQASHRATPGTHPRYRSRPPRELGSTLEVPSAARVRPRTRA